MSSEGIKGLCRKDGCYDKLMIFPTLLQNDSHLKYTAVDYRQPGGYSAVSRNLSGQARDAADRGLIPVDADDTWTHITMMAFWTRQRVDQTLRVADQAGAFIDYSQIPLSELPELHH